MLGPGQQPPEPSGPPAVCLAPVHCPGFESVAVVLDVDSGELVVELSFVPGVDVESAVELDDRDIVARTIPRTKTARMPAAIRHRVLSK